MMSEVRSEMLFIHIQQKKTKMVTFVYQGLNRSKIKTVVFIETMHHYLFYIFQLNPAFCREIYKINHTHHNTNRPFDDLTTNIIKTLI